MRRGITVSHIHACIMILLLGSSLFAGELRIGFVIHDEAPGQRQNALQVFSMAKDVIGHDDAHFRFSDIIQQRLMRERRLELLIEQHEHIDKTDVALEQEVPAEPKEYLFDKVPVEWIHLDIEAHLASLLGEDDRHVRDYLFDHHHLDILFFCSLEPFEEFVRLKVDMIEGRKGIRSILFDRIALPFELSTLIPQATLAITSYLKREELGCIEIESNAPGMSLTVETQGAKVVGNMVFAPPGLYEVRLTSPGYLDAMERIVVTSSTVENRSFELIRATGPPLLISGERSTGHVTIPGGPAGPLPLVWEQQTVPFVLYGTFDAARPVSVHVPSPMDHLRLEFEVPWMDEVYQVEPSQQQLYGALGRTMLLGALAVVADSVSASVSSTAADRESWQPLVVASMGACTVSAVDTVLRLFAYYRKTKYSSR